jgi:hypothetical protein
MDAGAEAGTLTTRPLTFRGKYLFVNADAPQGELRAEVLDEAGRPIAPFTLANGKPLRADSTRRRCTWNGGEDLAALAGRKVRLRFQLTNGRLYSFWVSPELSGASHGYVAAGGPGFTGPCDTTGKDDVVGKNAVGAVPPGAAALGYTKCVIREIPTAADVAPGHNGDYKWCSGQWYSKTVPPSSPLPER